MTKEELIKKIEGFVEESPFNFVAEEDAILPEYAGMRIFEKPLVGFSAADDRIYYDDFKKEGIVSPKYLSPAEWLPEAKTVISVFLPFTERVRESNRTEKDTPYEPGLTQKCSTEWLHARIEGHIFIDVLMEYIGKLLNNEGKKTVCPAVSDRFGMVEQHVSNWSERHAAYASGLGTFGLSRGIITEKGMAGRIGSIITDGEFEPDVRPYENPFEYCLMCGACQRRCPVSAIDITRGCALGKDQDICDSQIHISHLPAHGPNARVRYGCGKCQTKVPCEHRIPKKPDSSI